jgi:carbamoyl-phosphate synthase large subunit
LAKGWIDRYSGWGSFTAAEVLTKETATWIGLWLEGELAVCQGRRRLHWEYGSLSPSGVTGITGAQSTTSDSKIHQVALAAVASLPVVPHGIVSVDMTYDAGGVPNPTEIQASRFYTSIQFLAEAGLNLPEMYVEMALSGVIPPLERRAHPLPDDLLWLKSIDSQPILMDLVTLGQLANEYRV